MSPLQKSLLILFFGFAISFLIFFPGIIFAQEGLVKSYFSFDTSSPTGWVNSIYRYGLVAVGLFAAAGIIYGGVRYLTSLGNPEAISSAKNAIFSAIAGLVILLLSHMILKTLDPRLVNLRLAVKKLYLPEASTRSRSGMQVGQRCDSENPCAFGGTCQNGTCVKAQVTQNPNQQCKSKEDCYKVGGRLCENGFCKCNSDDDCNTLGGWFCLNGSCAKQIICTTDLDCKPPSKYYCDHGSCVLRIKGYIKPGEKCTRSKTGYVDFDCESGKCNTATGKCTELDGDKNGSRCYRDTECKSLYCEKKLGEGTEGECKRFGEIGVGGKCFGDAACASKICDSTTNKCIPEGKSLGEACNRDKECYEGLYFCKEKKCTILLEKGNIGDSCKEDKDCMEGEGLICATRVNECHRPLPSGYICNRDVECERGKCKKPLFGLNKCE